MKFKKTMCVGYILAVSLATSTAHANEQTPPKRNMDQQQTTIAGNPVYASFRNGIILSDNSGDWTFVLNGRMQADYRQFSPDATAADTFSVRRARLGGTLTLQKDFVARIEGEYAGTSTALTYGYIEYTGYKMAKIRVGQFKPLYGLERAMSANFTDFQERSLADALLGGTFDRGIMVYATPLSGLSYSMAYINGSGTVDKGNAREDSKDITARLSANLATFANWDASVVHVGGFLAKGSQASGRLAGFIPPGQSEGRGLSFFSTTCAATACGGSAALANAFADDVDRSRSGLEMALSRGPAKLQGEYIRTGFDGPGYRRDIDAWYTSAVWNLTGESFAKIYKDGMFGRLNPNSSFKPGGGWGAVQLGLRYSKFDAADFKSGNPSGSGVLLANPSGATDGLLVATNEAQAVTLGINWILNPNVRLIANWVYTEFATPVTVRVSGLNSTTGHENAATFRGQLDF